MEQGLNRKNKAVKVSNGWKLMVCVVVVMLSLGGIVLVTVSAHSSRSRNFKTGRFHTDSKKTHLASTKPSFFSTSEDGGSRHQGYKWECEAVCNTEENGLEDDERRVAIALPTLTFYLFSALTTAAVSFYMAEMSKDETCGDSDIDQSSVSCEMKDAVDDKFEESHYKCSCEVVLREKNVLDLQEQSGLDLTYMLEEKEVLVCGDNAAKYDLGQEEAFAKRCFDKVIFLRNNEVGANLYDPYYNFLGCEKISGHFENAPGRHGGPVSTSSRRGGFYEKEHALPSCRICDLDPYQWSDVHDTDLSKVVIPEVEFPKD